MGNGLPSGQILYENKWNSPGSIWIWQSSQFQGLSMDFIVHSTWGGLYQVIFYYEKKLSNLMLWSQTLDISGVGRITGEVCLCGDHLCNSAQQILANIKKYSFIYALLFIIVYMLWKKLIYNHVERKSQSLVNWKRRWCWSWRSCCGFNINAFQWWFHFMSVICWNNLLTIMMNWGCLFNTFLNELFG